MFREPTAPAKDDQRFGGIDARSDVRHHVGEHSPINPDGLLAKSRLRTPQVRILQIVGHGIIGLHAPEREFHRDFPYASTFFI